MGLEFQIVNAGSNRKPNAFYFDFFLVFALALGQFHLLIAEFVKVDEFSDRRVGFGRNFHQIQALLAGKGNRFGRIHYTQLLAVACDQTDLGDPNLLVGPGFVFVLD